MSTKKFDFLGKDIYCNALNFISSPAGGYYFFGGLDKHLPIDKRDDNPLLLYVDDSMKIKNTYFRIGHSAGGALNRFFRYDDKIILVPYSAEYNIFQFNKEGNLSVRYRFYFGEKGLPAPLNLKGLNQSRRKEVVASMENYILDLTEFFETDSWVYLGLIYKNYNYNVLYSKIKRQVYMTTAKKAENNLEEFRHWRMYRPWNNKFTMVIEASWFKMEMDRLSPAAYKKYNLDQFEFVKEDDNPVVVIYTMK